MELKEGMYVRTKRGIRKCITVDLDNMISYEFDKKICNKYGDSVYWLIEEEIEKHIIGKPSFNLIDLIEVGDYVNGYEVTSKDQFLGFGNHDWYMVNDEIKSIVTKEQFEAIKYEL